jgi:hypothetical protein
MIGEIVPGTYCAVKIWSSGASQLANPEGEMRIDRRLAGFGHQNLLENEIQINAVKGNGHDDTPSAKRTKIS